MKFLQGMPKLLRVNVLLLWSVSPLHQLGQVLSLQFLSTKFGEIRMYAIGRCGLTWIDVFCNGLQKLSSNWHVRTPKPFTNSLSFSSRSGISQCTRCECKLHFLSEHSLCSSNQCTKPEKPLLLFEQISPFQNLMERFATRSSRWPCCGYLPCPETIWSMSVGYRARLPYNGCALHFPSDWESVAWFSKYYANPVK